ncbi:hypothetical protein V502_09898, partial [Pseudogymnoascus sp. VKM F-4520 (FW-2644)]
LAPRAPLNHGVALRKLHSEPHPRLDLPLQRAYRPRPPHCRLCRAADAPAGARDHPRLAGPPHDLHPLDNATTHAAVSRQSATIWTTISGRLARRVLGTHLAQRLRLAMHIPRVPPRAALAITGGTPARGSTGGGLDSGICADGCLPRLRAFAAFGARGAAEGVVVLCGEWSCGCV